MNIKTSTYRILFYIVILLFSICFLFFNYFYEVEKEKKIEVIRTNQKLLAKQAIKNFNELVNKWNSLLSHLSNDKNIVLMNNEGISLINKIYEMYKSELKGITRTNEKGVITYTIPFYPNTIGRDISKQKHMIKILDNHKPVCSDVFKSVQGYDAIVIHYPIFKKNKYNGSLAFLFNFKDITENILKETRIGDKGNTWLISSEGTILFSNEKYSQGKSIYEVFNDDTERLLLAKKMLSGNEGKATLMYINEKNESEVYESYFVPVKILNAFWSLGISYSENEMIASLVDFRNKLIILFSLLFIGGIFAANFAVKGWIIVKKEEEKIKAEKEAKQSEQKYKSLFENINIALFQTNVNFELKNANKYFIDLFEYDENEIFKIPFSLLFDKDENKNELKETLLKKHNLINKEILMVKKNGEKFWASLNLILLKGENDNYDTILGSIRDITSRIDYIQVLKKHIEEKELLVNEIFHRTQNSLQVVISLLELQNLLIDNEYVKTILDEMIKRVYVMGIAHKQLYQQENLSNISFKQYIEEVILYLSDSYKTNKSKIDIKLDVAEFDILFDLALPCGLFFNEMINFFIINNHHQEIINLKITSYKENDLIFVKVVSDFNIQQKSDISNDSKLGIGIFCSLIENQLRTKINKNLENQVSFEFSFKDDLYYERVKK